MFRPSNKQHLALDTAAMAVGTAAERIAAISRGRLRNRWLRAPRVKWAAVEYPDVRRADSLSVGHTGRRRSGAVGVEVA